jgi:hypothetical protein
MNVRSKIEQRSIEVSPSYYRLTISFLPHHIGIDTIKEVWAVLVANNRIIKPKGKREVWVSFNVAYDHIEIEHSDKPVLEKLARIIIPVIECGAFTPSGSQHNRHELFNKSWDIYYSLNQKGIAIVWEKINLDTLFTSLVNRARAHAR